jgi:alpha-amylase
MVSLCLYFQVHQPCRLRKDFDFFSIGNDDRYEDDELTRSILLKVAQKCYLPANHVILDLIKRHRGEFKVAYSISGVVLEQFERFAPDVLASFQELVNTGCVELLGETYYHSLASLFSREEFRAQVHAHQRKIESLFGVTPRTFRNTELIYHNDLACEAEAMGYRTVLAEGADRVLDWRSPNFVYQPAPARTLTLLLKNYRLSDDVAFRFSNSDWDGYPLTAEKFAHWVHQVAGSGQVINLFMDYETFGEHQWADTGIFQFLEHLPGEVLKHPDFWFRTPDEISRVYRPIGELDVPYLVSWADIERDVSAWLGNSMQWSSAEYTYALEERVLASGDTGLIHAWRKLQTSDHFYYMCTKWFSDGDVHKYFSPYQSPYDAFVVYSNALNHLGEALNRRDLCETQNRNDRGAGPTALNILKSLWSYWP